MCGKPGSTSIGPNSMGQSKCLPLASILEVNPYMKQALRREIPVIQAFVDRLLKIAADHKSPADVHASLVALQNALTKTQEVLKWFRHQGTLTTETFRRIFWKDEWSWFETDHGLASAIEKMNTLRRLVPRTQVPQHPGFLACVFPKKTNFSGAGFSLFLLGWGGVGWGKGAPSFCVSTIVLFEHHRSVWAPSFCVSTIVLFEHHRSVWAPSFCLSTIVLSEHHRSVWAPSFCVSTIVLFEHHRSFWAPSFCLSTIVLCEHHRSVWAPSFCLSTIVRQRKS